MNKKYFSLERTEQAATINIYGDITSWAWEDNPWGDISAATLSKQLEALGDVDQIDVYINSYGGEVAEGLAIYNALRRHKAKVTTYCDGFACSIASVIFMAGDERVMNEASLLMIHNAWCWAAGNAEELRKQAEDLDKITQASVEAYKAHSSLSEDEIKELMAAETWILPDEAESYGFATVVDRTEKDKANQNAFMKLFDIIKAYQEATEADDDDPEDDPEPQPEPDPDDSADGDDPDDDPEPDDGDDPDDNDDDSDDDDPNNDDENANQKLVGFFNALLKM